MNRVLFSFTLLICIAGVTFSSPAPEPFPDDDTSDLNFKSILDLLQDKMVNTEEEENRATMEEDYANVEAAKKRKYQNAFDGKLSVECNEQRGEALGEVYSIYNTKRRDRRFEFSCVKVTETPSNDCSWQNDINQYREPIGFTCPSNYYIAGLKSYHSNAKEDRRWSVKCCRSDGYHTESCELTPFINKFKATMDFTAHVSSCDANDQSPSFFTGFYSIHDAKVDRRWKFYQCKAEKDFEFIVPS